MSSGYVKLTDKSGAEHWYAYNTKNDGYTTIDCKESKNFISTIQVIPASAHWENSEFVVSNKTLISIAPMEAPGRNLYRKMLGPPKSSGKGVTIGVIDNGFSKDLPIERMTVIDVQGNELSQSEYEEHSPDDHGGRVVALIAANNENTELRGFAPDSTIIAISIPRSQRDCRGMDWGLLCDAIETLARLKVDLINISGGVELPEGHPQILQLEAALAIAEAEGCLVLAAAGNTRERDVHYPAKSPNVIGVGGIGACAATTQSSDLATSVSNAIKNKQTSQTRHGIDCFLDDKSSIGEGIDCLAPSRSISFGLGDEVCEWVGTSFASPIVTSILACWISLNRTGGRMRSLSSTKEKRALLNEICFPLDFEGIKQKLKLIYYSASTS